MNLAQLDVLIWLPNSQDHNLTKPEAFKAFKVLPQTYWCSIAKDTFRGLYLYRLGMIWWAKPEIGN